MDWLRNFKKHHPKEISDSMSSLYSSLDSICFTKLLKYYLYSFRIIVYACLPNGHSGKKRKKNYLHAIMIRLKKKIETNDTNSFGPKEINLELLLKQCSIIYTEEQLTRLEQLFMTILGSRNVRFVRKEGNSLINPSDDIKEEVDDAPRDIPEHYDDKICDLDLENIPQQDFPKDITEKDSKKSNLCQLCGQVFCSAEKLKSHIRFKHKEKSIRCEKCERTFHTFRDLTRHVKGVHENKKEIQCQLCGKLFSSASSLAPHIRSFHLQLRPYSCDICKKSFTLDDTLKKHMKWAHSDEKPFSCDKCDKNFALQCQLKNHEKLVHNKAKKFQCSDCDMKFAQKGTLLRHIERIHDAKKHSCKICLKKFSWEGALKTHLKKNHENITKIDVGD